MGCVFAFLETHLARPLRPQDVPPFGAPVKKKLLFTNTKTNRVSISLRIYHTVVDMVWYGMVGPDQSLATLRWVPWGELDSGSCCG